MTTHGRGPLSRFWLGSTADGFIRSTFCPILLFRPSDRNAGEVDLASSPPSFCRVLVPLDGSNAAEDILPLAAAVAGMGASMVLLRAVPPAFSAEYPIYLPHAVEVERDLAAAKKEAEAYLHEVQEGLNGSPAPLELKVLTSMDAVDAILKTAEEEGADLIAMSTSARGGVSRLLMGSVADKVVRGTSIPLLLARQATEEREE